MKKSSFLNTIAIMTVFMVATSQGVISSALNSMFSAFPDVPATTVRLVSTGYALTAIFGVLIIGNIGGKKISFRTCLIIGSILILIGGVAPYLLKDSIYTIIASRMIFGLGVSFVVVRTGFLYHTYGQEKQASMLGYGATLGFATSMVMSIVCGFLVDIAWNYGFLVYAVAIIPVILTILFLQNPDEIEVKLNKEAEPISKEKKKLPTAAKVFALLMLLVTIAANAVLLSISTLVVEKEIGTAALAGLYISFFTAGGFFNLIFAKIYKLFKRWTVTSIVITLLIGLVITYFANSVPVLLTGAFLAGTGFALFMTAMFFYEGKVCGKENVTLGTALIMLTAMVANLISGYFISFGKLVLPAMGSEVSGSMILGGILLLIVILSTISKKIIPES